MSNSRRPLLLLGPYPPPFGGVSVHLIRLLNVLDDSRVPHTLVARTLKDPEKVSVVPSGTRIQFLKNISRHLPNAFCVHDHTEYYQWKSIVSSWFFSALQRRSGIPWILTIHDGTFPMRVRATNPIVRLLIRTQLRRYSAIIVINNELRETLLSLGVDGARLSLIKSFLPFRHESPLLDNEVKTFLESHHPIIAVSGAFHATYNFDVVAEAFLKVQARHPSAGLIYVSGSFTRSHSLEQRVRHLIKPAKESVLFTHDLPPAALLSIVGSSDLFIRSAFPDGDGMSMREAMILGTPVLATETGDRPEGIRTYSPRNAGLLANAILKSLEDNRDLDAIAQRTILESQAQANALLRIYKRYMTPPAS